MFVGEEGKQWREERSLINARSQIGLCSSSHPVCVRASFSLPDHTTPQAANPHRH
jgi:hypothetical protein